MRLRDVVHGEWIKFRSVRSTRWTLVVAGGVTVALGMIFTATAASGEAPGAAARLTGPVQLALGAIDLSAMIVGVLGVLLVAGEYSTGLIRTTIAAVGDRLSVLKAKAVVLAGATAVVMAAAAALASVARSGRLQRRPGHSGDDRPRDVARPARNDGLRDGHRFDRRGARCDRALDCLGDRDPGRRHLRRPAPVEPASGVLLRRGAQVPPSRRPGRP